jgi:hypothetical protein
MTDQKELHFELHTGGNPGDGSTGRFINAMLEANWIKTRIREEVNGGQGICGEGFSIHFYTTDESSFRSVFDGVLSDNPHLACYYHDNLVKSAEPWKPEPKPTRAVTRSMTVNKT